MKPGEVMDHEIFEAMDVLEGTEEPSSGRINSIAKCLEKDDRYDGELSTCRLILKENGWEA